MDSSGTKSKDDGATRRLSAAHLADLRKSGLSDETISACLFYSTENPKTIREILRWPTYGGGLGDCLVIPFFERDGTQNCYARLKPGQPRDKDDKKVRYESPQGLANRAYFPPLAAHLWGNPEIDLIITEGEKKAAKACEEGFPSIGLVGVYGWQKKKETKDSLRELIDDLQAIPWRGRRVYIVYDSDAVTKVEVRWAEYHLAVALKRKGAVVKVVRLPQGTPADGTPPCKVGLDDYLCIVGAEGFRERLAGAIDPQPPEQEKKPTPIFPRPIPAHELKASTAGPSLWQGILVPGEIALLSALWKAGKTTLLAHLLRAMELGGVFCGLRLSAAKVLYVTEESENRWVDRREKLKLGNHVHFLIRPFKGKPSWPDWSVFLKYLAALCDELQPGLLVLDTLSNLWPVRDENNAAEVTEALMPLHDINGRVAQALMHHLAKRDGSQATASRGSGALTAFVDTIIELRRFSPENPTDRRRVLTGYSRSDETPQELVIELTEEGRYVACGDRKHVVEKDLSTAIARLLPSIGPGMSCEQILKKWTDGTKPRKKRLLEALRTGAKDGGWHSEGQGIKGSPFTYWVSPPE
jgi:hypothetical protein